MEDAPPEFGVSLDDVWTQIDEFHCPTDGYSI